MAIASSQPRATCVYVTDAPERWYTLGRSPATLAVENLFLRKQLALYQERRVKPQRATTATRLALLWTLVRLAPGLD
jgi:hypothetical protein